MLSRIVVIDFPLGLIPSQLRGLVSVNSTFELSCVGLTLELYYILK